MTKENVSIRVLFCRCFVIIILLSVLFNKLIILACVPSESMQPILKPGSLVFGTRQVRELNREDILFFRHDNTVYIKRLIGLPGEHVVVNESGEVIINGIVLNEDYVTFQRSGASMEFLIPAGYLLFFGDNRSLSYDSRYWEDPYVPVSSVMGSAFLTIYPSLTLIGQENTMSKKTVIAIIALAGLMVILFWGNRAIKNIKASNAGDEMPAPVSRHDNNETPHVSNRKLPDFMRGEEREYKSKPIDTDKKSPTILTEDEIMLLLSEQLEKLRIISPDCLERVSPVTVEGQLNPFYYMMAAVMENDTARNAFVIGGAYSNFDVTGIEKLDKNNTYAVSVVCKTPYLVTYLQHENHSNASYYEQEYTGFVSSGAATAITQLDMTIIPIVSDMVDFYVVVQDDIPLIFYTASKNYGYNIPQYAFLWGSYQFDGVIDGDLQYPNILGAFTLSDRDTVANSLPESINRLEYIEQVVHSVRQGNFDNAIKLSMYGLTAADTFLYGRQMSLLIESYNRSLNHVPIISDKLLSCEISVGYYHLSSDDESNNAGGYAIELVYYPLSKDGARVSGFTSYAVRYPDEPENVINDPLIDIVAGLLVHSSG